LGQATGLDFWKRLVAAHSHRVRFVQMGLEGEPRVPGCTDWLMGRRNLWDVRSQFAAMGRAGLFMGVDSGPMHMAAAYEVPSLVFTTCPDTRAMFAERWDLGKGIPRDRVAKHLFLYEYNQHLEVPNYDEETLLKKAGEWLESKGAVS
jgi:hypothetical protein